MISPTTTLIYFIILTLTYFILKYLLSEKYDSKNKGIGIALTVAYLVITFIMQVMINISNAKERCGGTPQTMIAILYTVIPNLLIFGGLLMILMFFPGWKAPFSNTLGYLITLMLDVKSTFINILKSDMSNKLLRMVYTDPSLMINEITPENFDLFISKMSGKNGGMSKLPVAIAEKVPSAPPMPMPKPSAPPMPMKGGRRKQKGGSNLSILSANYKKFIPDLYNIVVIKDRIAEFVWYILTFYLVITNSHSYIMSIKCQRSVTELESKLNSSIQKTKKNNEKKNTDNWPVGY
tara:strand:- start:3 stop:881 length:879 start_codon:yes stop_codon:yes gene_type:complete